MVTGLAVLGAVAACEGLAKDIYVLLQKVHGAGDALNNLRIRFETDVFMLSRMLAFFKKWHNELPSNEAEHFQRLFQHLDARLASMKRKVEKQGRTEETSSAAPGIKEKAKWVLHGDSLEKDEADLFEWGQRLESMLAFLPARLKADLLLLPENTTQPANSAVSNIKLTGVQAQSEMQKTVEYFRAQKTMLQMPQDDEDLSIKRGLIELDLPLSSPWATARLKGKGRVFVDLIRLPKSVVEQPTELNAARVEVSKLTQVLRLTHPSRMHIFQAEYFFEDSGIPGAPFGIVYMWPDTMSKPNTILQYLTGEVDGKSKVKTEHPLEDRVRVAKHIITAVLYIHSLDWVHKSIRSDNVLLARSMIEKKQSVLGSAYLKGFDYSRRDDGATTGFDELRDWKREIYQHPDRQQSFQNPAANANETRYQKLHDVYSVGVVLLELCLWKSLGAQTALFEHASPSRRRDILIETAKVKVPPLLGGRCADIVQRCLKIQVDTAGDDHEFGGDFLCGILNDLDEIRL
jgi:serine/threonine protein kinase